MIFMYLMLKNNKKNMEKIQIYNYSYEQTFPFKVFKSKKTTGKVDDYLIHSKIYIIDDKTIFLSSSNFTESGMNHNIETMIKTHDKEAISKINSFFDSLLAEDFGKTYFTTNELAKTLYQEPINDYQNKKVCFFF
ncbi:MAG TPA: hypothetical protein ENN12_05935 [Epsilonproteobacteria bacterium]|nr:hypothetical protein [Campylobacterota bacterium]